MARARLMFHRATPSQQRWMKDLCNRMLEGKSWRERQSICDTAPQHGLMRKLLLDRHKMLSLGDHRR